MCFLPPSPASPRPAGGRGCDGGAVMGAGGQRGSPWAEQLGMSETSVFVLAALGATHTVKSWRTTAV